MSKPPEYVCELAEEYARFHDTPVGGKHTRELSQEDKDEFHISIGRGIMFLTWLYKQGWLRDEPQRTSALAGAQQDGKGNAP